MSNDNEWSAQPRHGQDVTGGQGAGMADINALQLEALLKTEDRWQPTFLVKSEAASVLIDDDGNVYVGEANNGLTTPGNVAKYDIAGNLLWRRELPENPATPPVFKRAGKPSGMCIDRSSSPNELVVASRINVIGGQSNGLHAIRISDGIILNSTYADTEPELGLPGPAWSCFGIAHDLHNNRFYLTGNINEVRIFDSSFSFVSSFGSTGSGDGEFSSLRSIAINEDGADSVVATADIFKGIQTFDLSGTFDAKVTPSRLGVAIDSQGDIYTEGRIYDSSLALVGERTVLTNADSPVSINSSDTIALYSTVDNNVYVCIRYDRNQTEFVKYTTDQATSLGAPDGGVSVPAAAALDSGAADVVPDHIIDVRAAIEALALDYAPSTSSQRYNWIDSDPLNLYLNALGNRDTAPSDFGFSTPSPAYDWLRSKTQMEASAVVVGTDGNDYVCIVAHTSSSDNKPVTGGDFADVWEATGGRGEGATWVVATIYSTNATYDIDIGEPQLCSALLQSGVPYVLGES